MDNNEALTAETAFFRQQPVFKSMPSSFFGIPNLTRRLTQLLVSRIKASLPFIKWEVRWYCDIPLDSGVKVEVDLVSCSQALEICSR